MQTATRRHYTRRHYTTFRAEDSCRPLLEISGCIEKDRCPNSRVALARILRRWDACLQPLQVLKITSVCHMSVVGIQSLWPFPWANVHVAVGERQVAPLAVSVGRQIHPVRSIVFLPLVAVSMHEENPIVDRALVFVQENEHP